MIIGLATSVVSDSKFKNKSPLVPTSMFKRYESNVAHVRDPEGVF